MRDRGDTAQIQRAEQTLERLDVVETKLVCFTWAVLRRRTHHSLYSFSLCRLPIGFDHGPLEHSQT